MTQETGLAAVLLLALAHRLVEHGEHPGPGNAVWAGLAAGAAALCRDYNLLYIPAALLLLRLQKAPLRSLALAALASAAAAAPWYLRNALRTGNPLYAHDLAGLLPIPAYHGEFMTLLRFYFDPDRTPRDATFPIQASLLVGLGVLCLSGLVRNFVWLRTRPALFILPACAAGLWLASVSSTAGGLLYSLRVLAPAIPFWALAAAGWDVFRRPRMRRLMLVAAAFVSLDAANRAFVFHARWDEFPPRQNWTETAREHARLTRYWAADELRALAAAADGQAVIFDNADAVVSFRELGGRAISIFAPAASPLTRDTAPLAQTVADLRARSVRFVYLSRLHGFDRFVQRAHPSISRLAGAAPAFSADAANIYDLALMNGESPRIALQPRPAE